MKIRVKYNGQSHNVDLGDRTASLLTLSDLLQAVANRLNLEIGHFTLSLNRSDFLSDNDAHLSDIGIVSGDLVYVERIGTEAEGDNDSPTRPDSIQMRPQPLGLSSFSSNGAGASSSFNSASSNHVAQPLNEGTENSNQPSPEAGPSSSDPVVDCGFDDNQTNQVTKSNLTVGEETAMNEQPEVNRYLLEPLTVRESTGDQVPALLNHLYTSATWHSHNEALWVVLHTLMLESGFTPSGHEEFTSMPDNWKQRGTFTCHYDYYVTSSLSLQCVVVGVTLGSSISVHGLSKSDDGFKTESLQLKADHFVRKLCQDAPCTYRALDHLSRQVKDVICLPLTNHLTRSAGFGEEQGLMAVPCELRIRLLSYLDARSICHLGATCSHWHAIYKDCTLWRRLYLTHFPAPSDCSLGRDWHELYKEKFAEQKRREREQQEWRSLLLEDNRPLRPFPVPGFFGPGGQPPFHPHIIGGDYDLNPEFATGIRDPMGGILNRGPGVGPRLPPSANPSFGLPGGPLLPRASRRGRSDLAGNPFSHF